MSETVKVVVEIETQEGMGLVDTHKEVEDLVAGLHWALGDRVKVRGERPFEVAVWMRVHGSTSAEEYGRMLKSQTDSETWCLVEGLKSAEYVEE